MKQEDKRLLLADLCGRVPYHPKGLVVNASTGAKCDEWLTCATFPMFTNITNNCRLYLRPMSSMTDEERYELRSIFNQDIDFDEIGIHILNRDCNRLSYLELQAIVNFFYFHHLDWCGMIPKRLALEAPENMYKEQNMKYERE